MSQKYQGLEARRLRVSQSLNITMLTRSPPLYAEIYKPPATQFLKLGLTSMEKRTPPMGDPKQQATPTAQAAASISELRDSLA